MLALTELAREEIDHFQRVLRGPRRARGRARAAAGRRVRRRASARRRTSSRAIAPSGHRWSTVCSSAPLIEARSCERFKLLAEATAGKAEHAELHALWEELLAAEARHYRAFVDLAERAAGGDRAVVPARLDRIAQAEGEIVVALARSGGGGSRATIHG